MLWPDNTPLMWLDMATIQDRKATESGLSWIGDTPVNLPAAVVIMPEYGLENYAYFCLLFGSDMILRTSGFLRTAQGYNTEDPMLQSLP
jgi:hypothetical protein